MTDYIAHLGRDRTRYSPTLCGETWQGWQAPPDIDLHDPKFEPLPPMRQPRRGDRIRECQACLKQASLLSADRGSGDAGDLS